MFSIEVRRGSTTTSVSPVVVSTRAKSVDGVKTDGESELPFGRIEELPGRAPAYWPGTAIADSLWRRIVRDALASDLLDDLPQKWSPLGQLRPETLGLLRSYAEADADLDRAGDAEEGRSPGGGILVGEPNDRLLIPEIALVDDDGEAMGAVVFGSLSAVAVLPAGTEAFRLNYIPTDGDERAEDEAACGVLRAYGDDIHRIMLWRTYFGTNTQITDAVSDADTWVSPAYLATARGASAVVFRPIVTASKRKKHPRDFTRHKRLSKAMRDDKEFAYRCPDLPDIQNARGNIVIAVHGTMACAVPLAAEIKRMVGEDIPVGRFEHDTWLPLEQNVDELTSFLDVLAADRVTLIAHSRGGLVAYLAAAQSSHKSVQVLTLGTPFRGTPIADAAKIPLLGFRCLLGVIRGAAGFTGVTLATRLAGFLIREVPEGIAVMEKRWSARFIGPPPKVVGAVCGAVTAESLRDTWTCHFLWGSNEAFEGEANDLVVAVPSASGDLPHPKLIECDHFSYWTEPDVENLIPQVVGAAPGELEPRPNWYKQPRHDPNVVS